MQVSTLVGQRINLRLAKWSHRALGAVKGKMNVLNPKIVRVAQGLSMGRA